MSELEKMYVAFRQEIDSMCAETLIENLDIRPVSYDGKTIGFLMLDGNYVDSFYMKPEYRGRGLGRLFIIGQYRKDNCRWRDLRVVKENHVAIAFWNNVFNLRLIDTNFCDFHYEILGLKEPDYEQRG